jgi:hypothetical protein
MRAFRVSKLLVRISASVMDRVSPWSLTSVSVVENDLMPVGL